MSRSQLVAEHLPLLRRYARALAGNQASGDAYVGAMLEALLQDPSLLDGHLGAARRPLPAVHENLEFGLAERRSDVGACRCRGAAPVEHYAVAPPGLPADALERFSEEDVAYVLGVTSPKPASWSMIAGREIAAEIATDVLIIEDETFIAMDLESLVENLGHNVIGVARTHAEAVEMAKDRKPGLILADIQLADGSSGLDAVNELLRMFEVPVVFITAYPERFLTGERPEPAFLIPKPFQPAMVSAVPARRCSSSATRVTGRQR